MAEMQKTDIYPVNNWEELNQSEKPGKGWHGDPDGHAAAGRKGGRMAHEIGKAHRFTPEEARMAGQKGGRIAHERGNAHEFTVDEAREAGRKGAKSKQPPD
jgi:general stress protein YciG